MRGAGESNVKQLREENESLSTKIAEASTNNSSLSTELTSVKEELATTKSKIEELTKANDELIEKMKAAEAEKRTSDRISALVEGGLTREEAEDKVGKFANLDDDQFNAVAETILEAAKMKKEAKQAKDEKNSTNCNDNNGEANSSNNASDSSDESSALDEAQVDESNAVSVDTDDDEQEEASASELRSRIAKLIFSNFEGDE